MTIVCFLFGPYGRGGVTNIFLLDRGCGGCARGLQRCGFRSQFPGRLCPCHRSALFDLGGCQNDCPVHECAIVVTGCRTDLF